jgi:hypothetical protein
MLESLQDFLGYCRRVAVRGFKNGSAWGRDQLLIGVLFAVLILGFQIKFGVIKRAEASAADWALLYPYLILLGAFLLFHVVRAVWQLDLEHRNAAPTTVDPLSRAERLAAFKEEGLRLDNPGSFGDEWADCVNAWADETRAYLVTCSRRALVVWDDTTHTMSSHYLGVAANHQQLYGLLERRIQNLGIILDKPDVYLS